MTYRSDLILYHVKGPTVLDIGCAGHGPKPDDPHWLHGLLRNRFARVVGIDIDPPNVETLRRAGFENVHVASAENFELGEKFDSIVAGEVIEHLSNPGLFLDRAREHLRAGGRVVLTTPNPFSLFNMLYAFLKFPKTCSNSEHTCWFCPRTTHELVSRFGFRVAHWELIEDYDPANPAQRYRAFCSFISLFRPLIPVRLRNNAMLFVIERS